MNSAGSPSRFARGCIDRDQ